MEFNDAYNVHCSLELISGRKIILDKLTQLRTYSGFQLGTPSSESNDLTIERLLNLASTDLNTIGNPYLIIPERRDYRREPGDMAQVIRRTKKFSKNSLRIPEWLPEICCIGFFHSFSPAHDLNKHASSLTVVWFQDDFEFSSNIFISLRLIDWDQFAMDYDY